MQTGAVSLNDAQDGLAGPIGELTPSVDGTVFAFFSGEAPSVAASGCGGTTSAGATAAVLAPQPIFHELRGSGRLSLSKNLRCNGKKQRCRGDLELVDAARSLGLRDSVLAYPHSPQRMGSAALVDGVYRDMGLA